MNIGFDTIGNASIICYDRKPVLVTDPWVQGDAYFGSWALSHIIPEEQLLAIEQCDYLWFSHGHPDHLNAASLDRLRGKTVLLPNHVGQRIHNDLVSQGFSVQILADETWTPLSDHIKIMCISDYNQDAILLLDINGRLVVNTNDAQERGWGRLVRNTIARYKTTFLLSLSGFGDADMINYFTEDGDRILPLASQRFPVGQQIARMTDSLGAKYFIPFSSMHRYQRADSLWANEYTTSLSDYPEGFSSHSSELLPAYIRYDCERDEVIELNPPEAESSIRAPEEFGDSWNDQLEQEEFSRVEQYFKAVEGLGALLDFINIRVGGRDHIVTFKGQKYHRGLTFDVPRGSLMTAVDYEVFDDLLIGNFMRTTLHGKWPASKLSDQFTPLVAKYSDNGRAKTADELDRYFLEYKRRGYWNFIHHRLEQKARDKFRSFLYPESKAYQLAKSLYWKVKLAA
jgi:hypothetical protein